MEIPDEESNLWVKQMYLRHDGKMVRYASKVLLSVDCGQLLLQVLLRWV